MISAEEFIGLYRETFLPAYADLVSYIADKPPQLLTEIGNTFSHIMVYLDSETPEDLRIENLQKAYNHLLRATLDCYKLLWVTLDHDIERMIDQGGSLAFNKSKADLYRMRKELKSYGREARIYEQQHIGRDPIGATQKYAEAVKVAQELLDSYDPEKLLHLKKASIKKSFKEHIYGFIVGIASGVFATMLYQMIF